MDYAGTPYAEPYQALYWAGHLGTLTVEQAQDSGDCTGAPNLGVPAAVVDCPPVFAAAAWRVQVSPCCLLAAFGAGCHTAVGSA